MERHLSPLCNAFLVPNLIMLFPLPQLFPVALRLNFKVLHDLVTLLDPMYLESPSLQLPGSLTCYLYQSTLPASFTYSFKLNFVVTFSRKASFLLLIFNF